MAKLTKKQIEYLENQTQKAKEVILLEVEKAMDLMENHFKKYCNEVSVEAFGQPSISVPMIYISESIRIMKKGYREGALNPKPIEEITEKPKEDVSEMP